MINRVDQFISLRASLKLGKISSLISEEQKANIRCKRRKIRRRRLNIFPLLKAFPGKERKSFPYFSHAALISMPLSEIKKRQNPSHGNHRFSFWKPSHGPFNARGSGKLRPNCISFFFFHRALKSCVGEVMFSANRKCAWKTIPFWLQRERKKKRGGLTVNVAVCTQYLRRGKKNF